MELMKLHEGPHITSTPTVITLDATSLRNYDLVTANPRLEDVAHLPRGLSKPSLIKQTLRVNLTF